MRVQKRFFIPEVIQTSAMDCGPASLKSLAEGFGRSVSYGRLREACQTDVDGTSIDTMEDILVQLGFDAKQIVLPVDHILLEEANALPAIVVVCLPNGVTHFVVCWRCHGPFVQVMDPSTGRRWMTRQRFLRELYIHRMPVGANEWRKWAGSDGFIRPLRQRLDCLKIDIAGIDDLIETAHSDEGYRRFAALDAATRFVSTLVRSRGIREGQEARSVLERFFKLASQDIGAIPAGYWQIYPGEARRETQVLLLHGAVLVSVHARQPEKALHPLPENHKETTILPAEVIAALEEKPANPGMELLHHMKEEGLFTPSALSCAWILAAAAVMIEALLFRGILEIGMRLGIVEQRLWGMGILVFFVMAGSFLQFDISRGMMRYGRKLELRLRIAFLKKIPRLGDRYFHSRLISDMAERSHSIHRLRFMPDMGAQVVRQIFTLLLTGAGIIWIDPDSLWTVITFTVLVVSVPFLMHPVLAEKDLRVRCHLGSLSRFYLDALLGLMPIRSHCAERAMSREHETQLVEWARSRLNFQQFAVIAEGIQSSLGFGVAAWLLFDYLSRGGNTGAVLLLVYWALNLPVIGQDIAGLVRQYPQFRNVTLRLLEPLGAPDESSPAEHTKHVDVDLSLQSASAGGVAVSMKDVSVYVGGHVILQDIDLTVKAGEHVAIVGPSGAGKSSLVGLLLGWHRPRTGRIHVDGRLLGGEDLAMLRRQIAWVDPAVQLWNRSLLDNVRYGTETGPYSPIGQIIECANLREVLEKLPDGFQTSLGEGGALVSGGEGQRVRLGRAMLRSATKLAILDEAFRGLDRDQRHELVIRARKLWGDQTLFCITHDVSETKGFDRVLVMNHGRIIEDGNPQELDKNKETFYHQMLETEESVREELWKNPGWRKYWLEDGHLTEKRHWNAQ